MSDTSGQDIRSQVQAWGEELKQSIASAIDQGLEQLSAKVSAVSEQFNPGQSQEQAPPPTEAPETPA